METAQLEIGALAFAIVAVLFWLEERRIKRAVRERRERQDDE